MLFVLTATLGMEIADAQITPEFSFTPAFGTDGENLFQAPSAMEEVPGLPGRFLVSEMVSGNIYMLSPNGAGYSKSLFGHIEVSNADPDLGLTGFAFHPDFIHNHKYFVRHGAPGNRRLMIDERLASADFLTDSGQMPRIILTVPQPAEFKDHNGGGLLFGADGFLYIGIGDGGWDIVSFDIYNNGQNRATLLGKILRIDIDKADAGMAYAIPKDNPFMNDPDPNVRREIFAYGLRNPYRMTQDRLTHEIYVADVGLYYFEKVFILRRGANYGWKLKEYTQCLMPGACDTLVLDPPAAYFPFGQVKCFIGGQVYRGDPSSPLYGAYIFGDHTMKRLLAFKKGAAPILASDMAATPSEPIAFALDSHNNLYMLEYDGTIFQVKHPNLIPMNVSLIPPRRPIHKALRTGSGFMGMNALDPGSKMFNLSGKRISSGKFTSELVLLAD